MATYNNNSSANEVKKLKQRLVDYGYDVDPGGVDDIDGENTKAAIKQYQQNTGDQTLKQPVTHSAQNNTQNTQTTPNYSKGYDSSSNTAYQQALAALQQAQQTMPSYAGTYDQQLNDIYNQIVNRDKFTYNMNEDVFYQQAADQYARQGEMAMMDTIGQLSSLTGGYGNSYAQMVGQQAYQEYLQGLNDRLPEFYGMALDQYNAEGDRLLNQYAMLGDMADDEYGKYQDALNNYWQNISYLKGEADDAYDRGYNEWYDAYKMGVDADERAYARQQDAYSRLVDLITGLGYSPTEDELVEAGMSPEQAKAYADYYAQQNAGSGSGSEYYYYTGDEIDDTDNQLEQKYDNRTESQIADIVYQLMLKGDSKAAVSEAISRYFTAAQRPVAYQMLESYISNGWRFN